MSEDEAKDLTFGEAQKKKEEKEAETIKAMNNAIELTRRMADVVGKFYTELRAQGISDEIAVELSKNYSDFVMKNLSL